MRARAASAIFILVGGCSIAQAQQSITATTPAITTNVRQVLVPVVVTDKKGRPVSNLIRSDFTVFEDNVLQRVVAFQKTYDVSLELPEAGVRRSAIGTNPAPANIGKDSPTRTYLICVDALHSTLSDLVQARRALAKFFSREHDPQAEYSLVLLGRRITVIQDSTRSASAILAALNSKSFQGGVTESDSSNIAFEAERLRRMLVGLSPQACGAPGAQFGTGTANSTTNVSPQNCVAAERRAEMFIASSAERTSLLTRLFIHELSSVINAMATIPTQRTLVLISDGFNLVPGKELFGIAAAYFPGNSAWKTNYRDTQPQINELLRVAQRNNIVVYGLDSRGVIPPAATGLGDASHEGDAYWTSGNAMPEMMRNEDKIAWENGTAMAELAGGSGGFYFSDSNDLLSGIRRAFDDERERYVLAYSPSTDSLDGKYRKIRVEVNKKNMLVHAKAGYWATPN